MWLKNRYDELKNVVIIFIFHMKKLQKMIKKINYVFLKNTLDTTKWITYNGIVIDFDFKERLI